MKQFFKRYSYGIVKMFVNQFAVGIFGAVLALATSGTDWLLTTTSVGAILFYLFLLYTMTWEIGAKDSISLNVNSIKPNAFRGVVMSLVANIPNILIAIIYTICFAIAKGEPSAVTDTAGVATVLSLILEGMYFGVLRTVPFLGMATVVGSAENPVNTQVPYAFSYFLIIVPAIVVSGLAYWLGTKNFHLTKLMIPEYPESDREEKPKKKND